MLTFFDNEHSEDEDRWITIGQMPNKKIVVVIQENKGQGISADNFGKEGHKERRETVF
jgi:uncharacterized DUF497 family protein